MIELKMIIKTPLGSKQEEQLRLALRRELVDFVKSKFDEVAQKAGVNIGHEAITVDGEITIKEQP